MSASPPYDWLQGVVDDGALVLTSSRRLARELATAYDDRQVAAGRAAWPTAPIWHWRDWLANTLAESAEASMPRLLDTGSATLLWEQSVSRTGRRELLSPASFVRHARQAWQRLHDWQVNERRVAAAAMSHDEHWYVRAAGDFSDCLAARGWIDAAQLPARCAEWFASGTFAVPGYVVHAGFDRMIPALEHVFAALQKRGAAVRPAPAPQRDARRSHAAGIDAAATWRAAGRWARERLTEDPHRRVAVVAPDLEADAATITRLVREGFAPGWQQRSGRQGMMVDASYGRRLLDYPLLAVAERCVRFAASGLPSAEVGALMRSPFLGAAGHGGRSRRELALRDVPDRLWRPAALLAAMEAACNEPDDDSWLQQCRALAGMEAEAGERHPPREWGRRIDALLVELGWPGVAAPDSEEFQLINRWRRLLNEFSALGAVAARLTLADALRRLGRIAADAVFQPEADPGGLPLLGALEAAGMEFDCLWVGGLDAASWPPAGQPLALVSRALQTEAGMPDATPADTLRFARRVLERLCASADAVQIAWPRTDNGESQLLPSPLLAIADEARIDDVADPGWYARSLCGLAACEPVERDPAPRVEPDEQVRGGAYTVQHMRSDPFAAFAAGRLAARPLEPFRAGLAPRTRGTLLHEALRRLLTPGLTRDSLAAWATTERGERAEQAAYAAIAGLLAHADPVLAAILRLEKERLAHLLDRFVEHEAARDDFTVTATEHAITLRHADVSLSLRIDRLDRLADGSLHITDYKSGTRRPFLDRQRDAPAALQMCVYARALERAGEQAIGGLTLIHIDSREIVYSGEGGSVPWGKASADDWPGMLEAWCAEVDVLLTRFAAGDIGVNSRQSANDARPLAILSRLEELRRVD
ncbi:MAG: PD-(D/E)XK nuclease family protein [Woeseiaceae bacterium]|nr:PD-(D/E)XK nuclease family protein [Woeseiaceae bacterium]